MPTYRTPDVYVEEISLFPPSVAEVETAIPAFIGYTEKARLKADNDLILVPTKIYSLKQYEQYFGGPAGDDPITMTIADDATAPSGFTVVDFVEPTLNYLLYYSVKLFFDNGGGKCYITSVGLYQAPDDAVIDLAGDAGPDPTTSFGLRDGLDMVALEDEPTLIVIPEAVNLAAAEYGTLVQAVLLQCGTLRDRFAIFDIFAGRQSLNDAQLGINRAFFGTNNLKYGAVYYPFLKTQLNYHVNEDETNVGVSYYNVGVRVATTAALPANTAAGGVLTATADGALPAIDGETLLLNDRILVKNEGDATLNGIYEVIALGAANQRWVLERSNDILKSGLRVGITGTLNTNEGNIFALTTADPIVPDTTALAFQETQSESDLSSYRITDTAVYNFAKSELKDHFIVLPPSGPVAGVYAATDTNRGVWKAPANVSVAVVIEPTVKLDNATQDSLNVDSTSGKSINALRSFAGKGTLVWGARTLDGNSNEWRYVNVRRFFNMVEESVKKSTYWAVFETNDANTWVKVRGMIENYLTQKWREGALAGATTKEAFFVKCGLGTTMIAQDILEGRMNVEIGMAVVRPAEFIILKFSHKLQTS
ncbi:MAG TPA: phage tail sheath C-terminal domain-containing protein [Chthoniobacterales bacterium]|nr:phage tail sheath C-terminal domain-containing protein [Chthoniobacterales bacterium]